MSVDPTEPRQLDDGAEHVDVPQLMSPLYAEHDEPRDGFEPIPLWLKAVIGGLLFWGGWYFGTYAGGYKGDVFDRPTPALTGPPAEPQSIEEVIESGRRLYSSCALCHQAEGTGVNGHFPPLKGIDWVVGEKSSVNRLIRILLHGMKGETTIAGEKYTSTMPAYGAQWKDDQVAAVLTFIRSSWGHTGEPVTAQQVAAVRKEEAGRPTTGSGAFTAAELLKIK